MAGAKRRPKKKKEKKANSKFGQLSGSEISPFCKLAPWPWQSFIFDWAADRRKCAIFPFWHTAALLPLGRSEARVQQKKGKPIRSLGKSAALQLRYVAF